MRGGDTTGRTALEGAHVRPLLAAAATTTADGCITVDVSKGCRCSGMGGGSMTGVMGGDFTTTRSDVVDVGAILRGDDDVT